ncbi:NADPH-dependent FMN reductase [Chitinimonas sp. BJYL2]|uniref:NADPH-dependent FMN reductase n=1 Tax=Chitinimonas sp. BJYL2 TaxID=2976696 RepID=UPI0022B44AD6|nr:NADPH-dependent FMN reductase [Chitinimonas sp. BJYL2]
MKITILAGSPSATSRSAALLAHTAKQLSERGYTVRTLDVRDFPPEDLVLARFDQPSIKALQAAVAEADGLVVGTPVYKAAYSGALKLLLDLLPERALAGKVVLPIATGGSPAHMLAVDYALKPVLSALNVKETLQGVYAIDKQIRWLDGGGVELDAELDERIERALAQFSQSLGERIPPLLGEHVLSERIQARQLAI